MIWPPMPLQYFAIPDYLGLDHIGHVEGPFSKLVPSKLKEMDDVIKMIHLKLMDLVRLNDLLLH